MEAKEIIEAVTINKKILHPVTVSHLVYFSPEEKNSKLSLIMINYVFVGIVESLSNVLLHCLVYRDISKRYIAPVLAEFQ